LIEQGAVALCSPVVFEIIFTARNSSDIPRIREELSGHPKVPVVQATFDRALEVQAQLAAKAQHRGLSLVDLLVAAAAEEAGLVVLHYDGDFDLIAAVTGQAVQWVVTPGSAD